MTLHPVRCLVPEDPEYPPRLLELSRPPAPLRVRGAASLPGRWVAIVGAREADSSGEWAAEDIAIACVRLGFGVVSGGARGIDAAAHLGALETGGRSVAVLASGLDVPTPRSNRPLFERMLAEGGLLVGERPDGDSPRRWAYHQRNRIIAALAEAVIVVQATRRSGSLITAEWARRLGRPVLAVPGGWGDRSRRGCCDLLQAGARPLCDLDDLKLELLSGRGLLDPTARLRASPSATEEASAEPLQLRLPEGALASALAGGPQTLEELCHALEKPPAEVLAELTQAELEGWAHRAAGGRFGLGW